MADIVKAILVAVDGSEPSDRAVGRALDLLKGGLGAELHLLNVQPNLGGAISTFISKEQIDRHHREEGHKGLASAIAIAKKAGVDAKIHIGVGRQGEVVREFADKLHAGLVVLGTRGHTGLAGVLLGSVAQDIIAHVDVPVTLVK
jgi:nucleotide-binding universal stress UspA family protein